MTSRKLRDPNVYRGEPTLEQINGTLVDIWSLISPHSASHSVDYTVTGKVAIETIVSTNTAAITITLNALPSDLQEVKVKRTNAQVTIDGNGKTIDGETTLILGALYDGPHLIYTDAAGEWSILS